MELEEFRKKILRYAKDVGATQAKVAAAIGLHPTNLSKRLNATSPEDFLNLPQIKQLLLTLTQWQAFHSQAQIAELLELAGYKIASFSAAEWNAAPLNSLQALPPTVESSILPPPLASSPAPLPSHTSVEQEDWGEAPRIAAFYGRETELLTVTHWLTDENCKLALVLGMGGLGKTTLATKAAQQVKKSWQYVFWRSLRNNPSVQEILKEAILFITGQQVEPGSSFAQLLKKFLECLEQARCLLILDNVESLLQENDRRRHYLAEQQGYSELFQLIAERSHQSCLLLTSREIPAGLERLNNEISEQPPTRILRLAGLPESVGQQILESKNLTGSSTNWKRLVKLYSGNPLMLKLIANSILELFGGNIDDFLAEGSTIFGEVELVLEKQFERLTNLEQAVIYRLALGRESLTLEELRSDIQRVTGLSSGLLFETLQALLARSLVEPGEINQTFTLQPVVMHFVTERLLNRFFQEIVSGTLNLLVTQAILKGQSNQYIRQAQLDVVVRPLLNRLVGHYHGSAGLQNQLTNLLANLRQWEQSKQGYAGGNLLNLLLTQSNQQVADLDLSNLNIWQAHLQGTRLTGVNLSNSDLSSSVFTQTFDGVMALTFSPTGKYLALGSVNGQLRILEVMSGQTIFTGQAHTKTIRFIVFSADGKTLASAGDDGVVKLWEISSGRCLQTYAGHLNRVWSVALSTDGKLLASGGGDYTVRLWDLTSGECLQVLEGHTNWVRSVVFSPDNTLLASGSGDCTVRLWSVVTGQLQLTLHGHTDRVRSVAFSADGKLLASGSEDKTIRLWDVTTGHCQKVLTGHTNRVRAITFGLISNLLVSGGDDETVRVWDVSTGEAVRVLRDHGGWIWALALSPDSQMLATGGEDQIVRLWDINTGRCLRTLQGYSSWLGSVVFSPTGQLLATGGEGQVIELWEQQPPPHYYRRYKTLAGHTNRLRVIAFSPDGKWLASGAEDCTVRLWLLPTGKLKYTLTEHQERIRALAFSPDSRLLVTGGEDRFIKLWEIGPNSFQLLATLPQLPDWVGSLAFSPDGKWFAGSGDGSTVRLWEVSNLQNWRVLEGHTDRVRAVAFSPDGQLVASGSVDSTARLWQSETGLCLHQLKGHTDRVRAVAFSPDGQLVATGGEDATVKVWKVSSGECVCTLVGHTNRVWSVAFAPDPAATILASAAEDGTVRLWDWQTELCLAVLPSVRPYEGLNITNVSGLTEAQLVTLKGLGAIDTNDVEA